jgi:hypothetical protein
MKHSFFILGNFISGAHTLEGYFILIGVTTENKPWAGSATLISIILNPVPLVVVSFLFVLIIGLIFIVLTSFLRKYSQKLLYAGRKKRCHLF